MNLKLQPIKFLAMSLSIGAAALFFTSCGDDEDKPKTIPTVETGAITDVTTEFATASGEITDDGNSTVTTAGFVYSSTNAIPTLENGQKVEITDTDGEFSAELDELVSGTIYHVRAFATNGKGTGYGDVVDFESGNAPPTATNVTVTGQNEVNKELIATYTYSDAEGNTEGTSTYKWYMANDATGTGEVTIAGATELTYTVEAAAQGKYIRFGVTPTAGNGPEASKTGVEVKSSFTAAIGEATTVTFMYNNQEVTYDILISEETGKKWMDRNLGAPNVPTTYNDYANYGDLMQWGRAEDGHQVIVRTGAGDGQATLTNTTNTLATLASNAPAGIFITPSGSPFDWLSPQNSNLWQGISGVNNPCPNGWRLPTQDEFVAEGFTSISDGYDDLNITLTGVRLRTGVYTITNQGWYWTSYVSPAALTKGIAAVFTDSAFDPNVTSNRAGSAACRCIKD